MIALSAVPSLPPASLSRFPTSFVVLAQRLAVDADDVRDLVLRDSEPGQHLDHLPAAVVGRVPRSATLVLCFHAVRQYEIAWRSTASAGKFDLSSRTGKTHFPDADFFRGREKNLSVSPRAVRAPERVEGFHPPYAIQLRQRMCSSHIRNSPKADDRQTTLKLAPGAKKLQKREYSRPFRSHLRETEGQRRG